MYIRLLGGRLKLSLPLLPVAAGMLYICGPARFAAFFLALFLHECAHALMARAVGARLINMELLPFGCAANMEGFADGGAKEAAVASAGPLINLVLAAGAQLLFPGEEFADLFVRASAGLAVINLLPALPMDGGRILAAVLGLAVKKTVAVRAAGYLGIGASVAAAGLFIWLAFKGMVNITIAVMSGFMLYSSIKSIKSASFIFARQSSEKRRELSRRTAIDVRHVAAGGKRTLGEVMLCLDPRKYNVVHVLGDDMNIKKTLCEGELVSRVIKEGTDKPIL